MNWVYSVLFKKGARKEVVDRLKRLYEENVTIVVVNNMLGSSIPNKRGSLRQGDVPSMFWFATGLDGFLLLLLRELKGIPLHSLPVQGPSQENMPHLLPPLTQTYKLVSYADDVKPGIKDIEEFIVVDDACSLLERASGVKLHRDPSTEKVKFLPLGCWKNQFRQEHLPLQCQYITVSDHLDFVGVILKGSFAQTRRVNGDSVGEKVKKTINPWRAGKFMPLTMRPHSLNTYALSKA